MRLDGSLEDFSLPDVLQLLTHTRKTGSLQLHAADDERHGLVRLASGAVNGASSDLRRHALARRLVGAGLVSDEALSAAAQDVRAGAPSLVRALLERADVSSEELNRLAADQVTDAVCELLRWSSGTFSFLVGESDPEGLELGLKAEDLVAEGERRMQVWPTLTSNIPSPDTVLRLAATPAFDPTCSREEWGLIALVDGVRSVNEIVALLGRSEFAVAGALSALVERGLLTISTAGSGLADLQRRQDIIAALEGPTLAMAMESAADAEVEPTVAPPVFMEEESPAAVLEAPASEVPLARSEFAQLSDFAQVNEPSERSDFADVADISGFADVADMPDITPRPMDSGSVTAHMPSFDQPLTEGSAALDLVHELHEGANTPADGVQATDNTARGLDSAVTKSLVLRLIAGVRGL